MDCLIIIACMHSLISDIYSCMICFLQNKINMVKRGTQKR